VAVFLASPMLVGALVALPWHHYAISVTGAGSFSFDRSGVQNPNGTLGIIAVVLAALLVVVAAVGVVGPPSAVAALHRAGRLVSSLGVALAVVLGVKLLKDTNFLGIGAWISVVLGIVVAGGALSLRTPPP
jgi:hypothetical protein